MSAPNKGFFHKIKKKVIGQEVCPCFPFSFSRSGADAAATAAAATAAAAVNAAAGAAAKMNAVKGNNAVPIRAIAVAAGDNRR